MTKDGSGLVNIVSSIFGLSGIVFGILIAANNFNGKLEISPYTAIIMMGGILSFAGLGFHLLATKSGEKRVLLILDKIERTDKSVEDLEIILKNHVVTFDVTTKEYYRMVMEVKDAVMNYKMVVTDVYGRELQWVDRTIHRAITAVVKLGIRELEVYRGKNIDNATNIIMEKLNILTRKLKIVNSATAAETVSGTLLARINEVQSLLFPRLFVEFKEFLDDSIHLEGNGEISRLLSRSGKSIINDFHSLYMDEITRRVAVVSEH